MFNEFYMIIWSGGYEPPQVDFAATFQGIEKIFKSWVKDSLQTEDIIDVYWVVRDSGIFTQELVRFDHETERLMKPTHAK